MLRSIKLSVDKVYIDPTSVLAHTGTSYQVATLPDFTIPGNLIVNVSNDTVNLEAYTFDYDMLPNQPLYVRTMYHFNNGTTSSWSNTIELNSNQVGLKSSNTVVSTPLISVKYDYTNSDTGELVAILDAVGLYSGAGTINATSWLIETTDGDVVYELPNSPDVLTELRLPLSELGGNGCFLVSAIMHTNTNADSNSARVLAIIDSFVSSYFTAELRNTLYRNSSNYILITAHATNYQISDVRITALDGSIVGTYANLDPYVAIFKTGNLDLNGYYIVEVRAMGANGQYTPWVEVYRGNSYDYNTRLYSNAVSFVTTDMGFGSYVDFNGLSAQTTQADEDDVFYLAIPETTTIAAYRSRGGGIYPIGKTLDLGVGELANIPNLNVVSLYDGSYLLDHSLVDHLGVTEVAKFTQCTYNRITKELIPTTTLIRPDERYGTGRTNSCVATKTGLLYYVPGELIDNLGNPIDLELRVLDIANNVIIDNIPLPVTGLLENVTIAESSTGDIYMFGGSTAPKLNALHGELVCDLLNSDIYRLDKINKTWTNVLTVTLNNANSYRYKMQSLRNGEILIIDATPDIIDGGVRDSYVYDPTTNTITSVIPNNPTSEHLGIAIEHKGGDIGLMSSTADLVESISFLRTTASSLQLTALAITNSQAVIDLVVPVGEVVYIRDPYRYSSITIVGTDLANTGTLVWVRDNVATSYFYNDLIVTRDMTLAASATVYNRVIVVGDAILTMG